MLSRHSWSACIWLCAMFGVVRSTRAQESPERAPALHWRAPPACPTSDAVRAAIESWLHSATPPADGSDITIDADVRAEGAGYRLQLALRSPHGRASQDVYAEQCETLESVIAMHALLAAAPVATSAVVRPEPVVPKRAPAARPRNLYTLGVGAGALAALFPRVATELSMQLGLERKHMRLVAGFSQVLPLEIGDTPGVRLRLAQGQLRACGVAGSKVALASCGGVDLGFMHGAGVRVTESRESRQGYVALALGSTLRVPATTRVGLRIGVEGLLLALRQRYLIRERGVLFRSDRFALRGSIGLDVRFP